MKLGYNEDRNKKYYSASINSVHFECSYVLRYLFLVCKMCKNKLFAIETKILNIDQLVYSLGNNKICL